MLGQLDIHVQRIKLDLYLTPYQDLNIKPKTLKLLNKKVKANLYELGLGKAFLDTL